MVTEVTERSDGKVKSSRGWGDVFFFPKEVNRVQQGSTSFYDFLWLFLSDKENEGSTTCLWLRMISSADGAARERAPFQGGSLRPRTAGCWGGFTTRAVQVVDVRGGSWGMEIVSKDFPRH